MQLAVFWLGEGLFLVYAPDASRRHFIVAFLLSLYLSRLGGRIRHLLVRGGVVRVIRQPNHGVKTP